VGHDLPAPFRVALERLIAGRAGAALARSQQHLSRGYRGGRPSREAVAGEDGLAAYLAARLPATHAAVHAALERLAGQWPEFAPRTQVDIACGPGTALIAAAATFPSLIRQTGLDRAADFLDLAHRLFAEAGGRPPEFHRADMTAPGFAVPGADLISMAYALVECDAALAGPLAVTLFAAAAGALVLVEPGTPAGFERLRNARTALIGAGAHILAPCPHQAPCPMTAPDWCHFAVRLNRSRTHQRVKQADVPFEDEKFAYLIAARATRPAIGARILSPPRRSKPGITVKLCRAGAIESRLIAGTDPGFSAARRLDWGDWLEN